MGFKTRKVKQYAEILTSYMDWVAISGTSPPWRRLLDWDKMGLLSLSRLF